MKKWISRIGVLLLIIVIFQLSSTSSLRVIEPKSWINETEYQEPIDIKYLLDKESEFYDGYFKYKKAIFQASINFFAHKLSHIMAYSLLTILIYFSFKKTNRIFLTWFLVTSIAMLDEINQFFVIGRTGLLLDVLLDSLSSMITIFFLVIMIVYKRVKKKKRQM